MPRLIEPGEFLRAISDSPRLKVKLAWLTFGALAIPAAALVSLGLPERYILPAVLLLIVPFQYAVFCLLRERERGAQKRRVVHLRLSNDLMLQEASGSLLLVTYKPAPEVQLRLRAIDAMVQLGRYEVPLEMRLLAEQNLVLTAMPESLQRPAAKAFFSSLTPKQRAVIETLPNFTGGGWQELLLQQVHDVAKRETEGQGQISGRPAIGGAPLLESSVPSLS